jgi:hypothetical protein
MQIYCNPIIFDLIFAHTKVVRMLTIENCNIKNIEFEVITAIMNNVKLRVLLNTILEFI